MIDIVLQITLENMLLRHHSVTVDSVERLTKMFYFPHFSETQKNRLEAAVNYDSWR